MGYPKSALARWWRRRRRRADPEAVPAPPAVPGRLRDGDTVPIDGYPSLTELVARERQRRGR